jgi:hypothetical protein
LLFDAIEDAIIELLKESEVGIADENFFKCDFSPGGSSKKQALPALSLYDIDMTFGEQTLGSNLREKREESTETFSGDGQTVSFSLSSRPLRPLIGIENPLGNRRRENHDFKVDYEKGQVNFETPPEKGRKNVLAKYFPLKDVALVSGLHVNLRYNFDIYDADRSKCNDVTLDVVKALLLGRDKLASRGLIVKPLSCKTIDFDVNSKSSSTTTTSIFGRTLECQVDTDFYVATPVPPIERIEIEKKIGQNEKILSS